MIFGYVGLSPAGDSAESQKNLITRYLLEKKWSLDEWIQVELASPKQASVAGNKPFWEQVSAGDIVICASLSGLGHSTREILVRLDTLLGIKKCRLILLKEALDIDPGSLPESPASALLALFPLLAQLDRNYISRRTKDGLKARLEAGIKLGKPKGVLQKSVYDPDKERIFQLYQLGVPIRIIIEKHLGYGKYFSLKEYIEKRLPSPIPKLSVLP